MQNEKQDQTEIRLLYKKLLESWNNHDAEGFSCLFTHNGNTVGFDGSGMNGREEIAAGIRDIFAHHQVASYVGIIRQVQALSPAVFILRAVAGMVPPGAPAINPAVNAIQTMVAVKDGEEFQIASFQNTPAAFHGRPELSRQLTDELQQAFNKREK